jgi:PAS domain S-box-containing protein
MKPTPQTRAALLAEIELLQARLVEAESTLQAIHEGAVDGLVVQTPNGPRVFTLQGAETPYRVLVEAMNEGAATLSYEGSVLYANRRLAKLVGRPLEFLTGGSIFDTCDPGDQDRLRTLLATADPAGVKGEFTFVRPDGNATPVLLSISPLNLPDVTGLCLVAADLTKQKHAANVLRNINERLKQRVTRRTSQLQQANNALQDANETLTAQAEELQAQAEELAATNEELRLQTEQLLESENHLRAARAEAEAGRLRLEAVMEALPVGMAIIDDKGGNVDSNGAFEEIWGRLRSPADSVFDYAAYKAWWLDTGKPVAPEEWASAQVLRTGQPVIGQLMKIQRFDRTYAYVINSAAPICDADDEVVGCAVAIQDITALRQAEEALRRLNADLEQRVAERTADVVRANSYNRSLIEASLDPLVTIGTDGIITDVNRATEQATGCTREELIGTDFSTYFTEPDKARTTYEQVFLEGSIRDYPLELRRRDGHTISVLYNASVYRDEMGEPVGVFAAARDITDRKRAEEAIREANETLEQHVAERTRELRESEALLRAITDNSPDAIFVKDSRSRWLMANPAVLRVVGRSEQEALGKTDLELYADPQTGRAILENDRRVLEGGEPRTFEEVVDTPDGQRVFLSTKAPQRDVQGRVVGLVGISRDITERKKNEETLLKSEERFRLLAETASRLLAADKPQEVVNDLCRKVMTHLNCEAFFNFLVDEQAGRLHLNACAGVPRKEARKIEWLDYGTAVCGCVAQGGERIVVEDIPNAHDSRTDLVASYGIQAYACHPLVAQGRVLGTLSFGAKTRTRFNEDDLSLMKMVADQVAVAMDRIHSQEALAGSEQELRLALDGGGMGRWEWDLKSGTSRWCERTYKLLGLEPGDGAETRTFLDVVHSQDRPILRQHIKQAALDGPDFQAEFRVARSDGPTSWLTLRGKVIRDSPGRAVRMMGVIYDIAHRKQLEADLRQLNERLEQQVEQRTDALAQTIDRLEEEVRQRALIEKELERRSQMLEGFFQHTLTPLAFMDKKFNFIRVNDAYARADGKQPQEFIGCNYFDLYPDKENRGAFRDVVRTKEPYHGYARSLGYPRQPRRTTYWNWLLTPLLDETSEVQSLVLNLEDVTDRQRAFEELERRASQLQRLTLEVTQAEDRERQRLARILHDDLQQLLVGAKFQINTLTRKVKDKDNEEVKEMLAQVYSLISESIDKSRSLSHELMPPLLYQASLGDALAWLGGQMRQTCGLTVEVDVVRDVDLNSDTLKSFMYKAAHELLLNVVKHAQVKEAKLQLRRMKGYLRLIVSDEGHGFDPDSISKAGGFGLFSIQERARLLGGWMKFKSTPGSGSVFILAIPDNQRSEARGQRIETTKGEMREPASLPDASGRPLARSTSLDHPLRVMLVDDHKVMREGVATMLDEQPDIEVVGQAGNGRDAVSLAKRLMPDVIVMDVAMPIMDGEEATRKIKAHLPRTRIIGLSLSEEAAVSRRMQRAGAEQYISKADPSEALLSAIRGQPTP